VDGDILCVHFSGSHILWKRYLLFATRGQYLRSIVLKKGFIRVKAGLGKSPRIFLGVSLLGLCGFLLLLIQCFSQHILSIGVKFFVE
jgi:hypothetical protein